MKPRISQKPSVAQTSTTNRKEPVKNSRMRQWMGGLSLAALIMTGCAHLPVATQGEALFRPRLLLSLGDDCNTPDGMRLCKTGDLYLAFPNVNQKEYPGKIMKITKDNKLELVTMLPVHPETGCVAPMGMDFGPDGNLYVADNQYFYNTDHKSRVLRVVMKGGRAIRVEVAVEGFKLSNAVMFRGNDMFVTDTFFDREDKPGLSGVYRISLDEMNKGTVKLLPKTRAEKDPHFFMPMYTKRLLGRGDWAGADGLTFDSEGNLYAGNFGDGTLYKATFNPDGSRNTFGVFVYEGKWTCCDGIFYDRQRNCIFAADSENNAIRVVWLPEGRLTTLWENGDTDGADGLLDQPCEVALRGNELIVVNFDMPFPGMKNTKYDQPHTICMIDVSLLQRSP